MKAVVLFVSLLLAAFAGTLGQGYTPTIEPCDCKIKVAAGLIARCGYLVVPENRQKPHGRTIKVPFVFARQPGQDAAKNILLYTTGGPGYSTIAGFDSLRYNSDYFQFGGFIAFDQRALNYRNPVLPARKCGKLPSVLTGKTCLQTVSGCWP